MSSSQQDASREVLRAVHDFLGGPTSNGDEWCFDFGEHLESNWGAVYGGALAAGMLAVARSALPERSPRSLHIQIVRSVPSGRASATATIRHGGRTVATVEVELYDERRKLAAIALVTMVTPDAVAADYDHSVAAPPFHVIESPHDARKIIPGAPAAPIIAALKVNVSGGEGTRLRADNVRPNVDGSPTAVVECTLPWEDLEYTGPEAACLIADLAVAMPVEGSYISVEDIGPNADLTLRFTTAPATTVITAASTMLSVQRGTATIGIEVQAGDNQLAHALASSLLLRRS
jgi:acyl-coenzyme A thioesterase PaaI-like protein